MELKEFIKDSLTAIIQSVQESKKTYINNHITSQIPASVYLKNSLHFTRAFNFSK